MVNPTEPAATELETFLPQDGSNMKDGALSAKYKVQVLPRDAEAPVLQNAGSKTYDPFAERQNDNPTTDCDTLTHLLKASLGTGILSMPYAFKSAGLIAGIFATVLVSIICTHCAYVLVKCGQKLYHRTRKPTMTFSEVTETAFATGPEWGRRFAPLMKYTIQVSLFVTYYGTCSVYAVIVAGNIKQVIDHYTGDPMNDRAMIAMLLLPLILLGWVPNLRYLAPVSMVANGFMAIGLGITFYYLIAGMQPITSDHLTVPIGDLPQFFSITIFAIEAIGVVMPLENNMKTPQHFLGLCGVLNKGMSGVTLIYILLGFLGFVAHGSNTQENIILNLSETEVLAQSVKILIALAVYCTFGLQFYVCYEIAWNAIKESFTKRPLIAQYILRTGLVTGCVLLAVAVPSISPFMGLIGAFCFSILGLVIPLLIEIVTCWDEGFGPGNWVLVKNVIICILGFVVLVFGSHSAIIQIIDLFSK
ncbi:proton-coupled amino acid transporter-like protein pathetic [Athalia rosae]|uniref:proton-coupled amino acid transporter-like protein pathetic n=1 Tax=Athalia rosae TaxID=37344 RepID=UPI0020346D98|nr:proton-coupled amino acid transporter-like protein pathetic [Athalia rosae]